MISIHALLAESDFGKNKNTAESQKFLSTLSLRRATVPFRGHDFRPRYFYPRSPCGERPTTCKCRPAYQKFLSTLSLRRATTSLVVIGTNCDISIHALLAESDPKQAALRTSQADFYPRSPCGERPVLYSVNRWTTRISIHALLAESDLSPSSAAVIANLFLSTLSLRRATLLDKYFREGSKISIHALLAESDLKVAPSSVFIGRISIHALLAESDPRWNNHDGMTAIFLSTLSLRRATFGKNKNTAESQFLSTLSLRRATFLQCKC